MEKARLDTDQRRVVRGLARQYGVGMPHVKRVAELAAMLFEGLPLAASPPTASWPCARSRRLSLQHRTLRE
ncbi:MAG: hypothetical protein WDO18_19930 [Acidobacteriota bacterium]